MTAGQHATTFRYGGESYTGPSPQIWDSFHYAPERFGQHYDDFTNFSDHISDQQTQQYSSYIDTGVTINQLAQQAG